MNTVIPNIHNNSQYFTIIHKNAAGVVGISWKYEALHSQTATQLSSRAYCVAIGKEGAYGRGILGRRDWSASYTILPRSTSVLLSCFREVRPRIFPLHLPTKAVLALVIRLQGLASQDSLDPPWQ